MTVEKNKNSIVIGESPKGIVIGESPEGNAGKIVIGESIPNKSEPIVIEIISGSNQGN